MGLKSQKRLAAEILKVGISRVWIDPESIDKVAAAITREEIRSLIKEGAIQALPKMGVSRARVKKGRKGPGSRKRGFMRRQPWEVTVRSLRAYLKTLRDKEVITRTAYRKLYRMAKGGFFESKAHLRRYIESEGLRKK